MKSILVLASTVLHANIRLRSTAAFVPAMKRGHDSGHRGGRRPRRALISTPATSAASSAKSPRRPPKVDNNRAPSSPSPPLYLEEGLLAVHKPLTWTSNDVVSYIRGILTRDAHERGAKEENDQNNNGGGRGNYRRRNRSRKPLIKVGHGGTLDPLASGVLVLGVGSGTKFLQSYLEGSKRYSAVAELGYETDTLDAEGKIVKTASCDHVTDMEAVREVATSKFKGKIKQVPPLYSAIRIDGKRLYEIARKDDGGKAAEKVEIPEREVEVFEISVGTELEEEVVRSGVVDGEKYRTAVEVLEAAAAAKVAEEEAAKAAEAAAAEEAAAAKAAEAVDDAKEGDANTEEKKEGDASAAAATDNAKEEDASKENANKGGGDNSDSDGSNRGNNKRKRRRKESNKKKNNNFKKCPFDETTVPSVLPATASLSLPRFSLNLECGGGLYVRSLVRDVGYELDTVATMTGLVRTKQGPFGLEDALRREDWTAEKIWEAIGKGREKVEKA